MQDSWPFGSRVTKGFKKVFPSTSQSSDDLSNEPTEPVASSEKSSAPITATPVADSQSAPVDDATRYEPFSNRDKAKMRWVNTPTRKRRGGIAAVIALLLLIGALFIINPFGDKSNASAAKQKDSVPADSQQDKRTPEQCDGYNVVFDKNEGNRVASNGSGGNLDANGIRQAFLDHGKHDPRTLLLAVNSANTLGLTTEKIDKWSDVTDSNKGGCYNQRGRDLYQKMEGLYNSAKASNTDVPSTGVVNTGVNPGGTAFQEPGVSGNNRQGAKLVFYNPDGTEKAVMYILARCLNVVTPKEIVGVEVKKNNNVSPTSSTTQKISPTTGPSTTVTTVPSTTITTTAPTTTTSPCQGNTSGKCDPNGPPVMTDPSVPQVVKGPNAPTSPQTTPGSNEHPGTDMCGGTGNSCPTAPAPTPSSTTIPAGSPAPPAPAKNYPTIAPSNPSPETGAMPTSTPSNDAG